MISTYLKKIFPNRIQFFTLALLSSLGWSVVGPLPQAQAQIDWNNFTGIPDPYFHFGSNWIGGAVPGSADRARFATAMNHEVWWDVANGPSYSEVGFLSVDSGNVIFSNRYPIFQPTLVINGSPDYGELSDFEVLNAGTSLTVSGMHIRNLGGGLIRDGATLNIDGSHPTGSKVSIEGFNFSVDGNLNVMNGGELHSLFFRVGDRGVGNVMVTNGGLLKSNSTAYVGVFGTGRATISGSTSRWISESLLIGFGGTGELRIESGGQVNSEIGSLGTVTRHASGIATVTGAGSQWNVSDRLFVGADGRGSLTVSDGGVVTANRVVIGADTFQTGVATIANNGSELISHELIIGDGPYGTGTLNVQAGGRVRTTHEAILGYFEGGGSGSATVTGNGSIWDVATRMLVGHGPDGHGQVSVESGGVVNSLDTIIGDRATSTGGVTVHGTGSQFNNTRDLWVGLNGQGRLNVLNDGKVVVGGHTQVGDDGLITNIHGTFAGNTVAINTNGIVFGRGRFEASGGWTNSGTMIFTSGTSEVTGNINNLPGGRVSTVGAGTTYFYGDVVHNGRGIETDLGSTSEFHGMVSGSGPFTGAGTVRFLGGFRPGSSPAIVSFEGNLEFGDAMETLIELGGLTDGQYDRLVVEGDLALDGDLMVSLINQHQLSFNQEYLIADIGGLLSGQFNGFDEGALLGNFGGHDLFITYQAGDGNDIAFFTAVPEPGVAMLFGLGAIGLASSFRRRHQRPQRSV
ncbi:MAG: PEP-CTERM sorting domain-containing protein [Pirellulaceae bacterium]